MERGRGEREEGNREGTGRERELGREGGARAKPGNQLVLYIIEGPRASTGLCVDVSSGVML